MAGKKARHGGVGHEGHFRCIIQRHIVNAEAKKSHGIGRLDSIPATMISYPLLRQRAG